MKAAKLLGRLLLGALLLVVLAYLVLVAINWNDRPPSAAALRFEQIIASRPQVSADDNAVVYILGFGAPTDGDPVELGARRMAWLESFHTHSNTDAKADPLSTSLSFRNEGSPLVAHLVNACGQETDRMQCASVFNSIARAWQPSDLDALALRRYEALLTRRAWRDVVPLDLSAPLPEYNNVLHAQRLYLLRLAQWGVQSRVAEVREGLSADFAFWRTALPAADSLIGQMIAVAALRQHYSFANLILRDLNPDQVARATPLDWTREFSVAERSMLRVMAAETTFLKDVLSDVRQQPLVRGVMSGDAEPSLAGVWLGRLSDPMFQLQDTVNARADQYLRLCEDFAVPMTRYLEAQRTWMANDRKPTRSLYNPVGNIILASDDGGAYVQYALRVASVEGMRRAVLLSAQLHARDVQLDGMGEEIARSEWRDPYTEKPFEWNAARRSVTFVAPEEHQWRRNEYFF